MTPVVDPTPLFIAGAGLLAAFAGIGMIDGAYFHIVKYKLHTRRESFVEHITHTLNAIFFPPIVYLLLYRDSAGLALWAAAALVVVDVGIESWDVLIERCSRSSLGGLTPVEYWIHMMAVTLRIGGMAVLFAARPLAAWSLSAPSVLSGEPPHAEMALGITYVRAVEAAGGIPVVMPPLGLDEVPDLVARLDGVVLSGGPDLSPAAYLAKPHPDLGGGCHWLRRPVRC